ncbi:hypothetical protein [Frankia tisae]|uniref:hypothetical protein n=1 Tax=Frankia tisae TaxID=2950104 RepID=UPI0021C12FC8|nr:hypothetical protein [Frankia tisae]
MTVWAGNCSAIRLIFRGTVTFSPERLVTTWVVGAGGLASEEELPQPAASAATAAAIPRVSHRRDAVGRANPRERIVTGPGMLVRPLPEWRSTDGRWDEP